MVGLGKVVMLIEVKLVLNDLFGGLGVRERGK